MAEDFSKNLGKGYKYWEIYVHENQGYLERCVVQCKRKDVLDLTDVTPEEHLHGHFVPRYAKPKTFNNIVFEDKLYGHNYKTDPSFQTPPELLLAVRDKYREALK